MPHYTRKPETVEAVQYKASGNPFWFEEEFMNFFDGKFGEVVESRDGHLSIFSLGHYQPLSDNNWIVKEGEGFRVWSDEDFRRVYEV